MKRSNGVGGRSRGPLEQVRKVREVFNGLRQLDLKALRESGGLSQEAAARIAEVSVRTWYSWEKHLARPDAEGVERVCRYVEELERKQRKAA